MTSPAELAAYVSATNAKDTAFVEHCYNTAVALVSARVGLNPVPTPVLDQAVLAVGSEIFHQRQAPNGIAQFAVEGATSIRVARDPMVAAYPLLSPYVLAGLA